VGGTGFDEGIDIAVDGSGNTYVTGSFVGGGRFTDFATFGPGEANETTFTDIDELSNMFVAKYATNGNLIWAKRTGGNASVMGFDIAVDNSGNTYVTGLFSAQLLQGTTAVIFGPGEANETTFSLDTVSSHMFVAKYTTDGNLVWAKRASGTNSGIGIAVDDSGNAYVMGTFRESATFGLEEVGETTLTSDGESDIFVAKYTADSDLVWVRRAGGTDVDRGGDIVVDGLGDTYVTGSFRESATFGLEEVGETTLTSDGESDIFVAKYTADG
jgi:hypothetical protein